MAWSCSVSYPFSEACLYCPCCFPPGSFVFVNLSPVQLPSPAKAPGKFSAAITEMLLAEEKEDDHPDTGDQAEGRRQPEGDGRSGTHLTDKQNVKMVLLMLPLPYNW